VSHIFGRTKNPFLFEAPWNIAFVPKIIDPFTGHETKGCWPDEYQELFSKSIRNRYKGFIDDYNSLIKKYDLDNKINEFITNVDRQQVDDNQIMQFSRGIKTELSVI
jgi:hypothetical protein